MKNQFVLRKCIVLCLTLGLASCSTHGEMHRQLAAIDVLSEADLAQELQLSLAEDQRDLLVEEVVDLPDELKQTLQDAKKDQMTLTVGEWHEIALAIRKDQVRNPERYDGKGPLAEILHMLVVELEEAGYPHMRHPTAVRWQKEHLAIKENLSSHPSKARVRVVDQDGEPLEGVTLNIDKSYHPPWALEPISRGPELVIDEEVTFGVDGAFLDDILLEARKGGYYPAKRYIDPPRREKLELLIMRAWNDVVLGRETVIDPEEPKLLNVVMELRKKGKLVELYRFDGTLAIRADGSGRILRLTPPENAHPGGGGYANNMGLCTKLRIL